MDNLNTRQALAWCLFLALALSLFGVGGAASLRLAAELAGDAQVPLLELGGPLALLVGLLFLSLAFASRRWARVWALLLLSMAAALLFGPFVSQAHSSFSFPDVSALPGLDILLILGCVGSLLALTDRPFQRVNGGLAVIMVAGGLINLVIPEVARPAWTGLTRVPNLVPVKAVLITIFGVVLPLIPTLCNARPRSFMRPVLWLGCGGILATLAVWQVAQSRHHQEHDRQADLIATGTLEAIEHFYENELAAVPRMAERFQVQGAGLSRSLWQQETESYFRDLPFLDMIAIIDHRNRIQRLEARELEVRFWLGETFDTPKFRVWTRHEHEDSQLRVHSSGLFFGPNDQKWSFFSVPIRINEEREWSLLALVDVETALQWLSSRQIGDFDLSVASSGHSLFDSQKTAHNERKILVQKTLQLPHDEWVLTVSRPLFESYLGEFLTSTLILFGGLAMTTLLMVSRLFGIIATGHNKQLQLSNHTLEQYLDRERELRATNQRIIDSTSDLLCTIDLDGYLRFVSPASKRILGYSPEEMVNRPSREFIHEDDWEASQRAVERLKLGQASETYQLRNRYRHRDGRLVTLDWKARLSSEESTLFCVGRDVSAELKAEALAQQREAFFSITPEMFCIVFENKFVEINQAFVQTLGYERQELLGRAYVDIVHPDYRDVITNAMSEMRHGKQVYELETQVFHRNGSVRWLRLNSAMSEQRIYCSARDVTEEKEVQRSLREKDQLLTLAERMGRLGGWMFSLDSRQPIWSDAVCEIHDLPPGEVPTIDEAMNYYVKDYRAQVEEAVRLASELGLPFDVEAQIISAKGRLRWVRAMGQAVRDERGVIVALQGAFQDITDSKEATEQIRRLAERQATIFESITDAFFTLDTDWQFTFLNERCAELLQQSREALLGESIWDAFPEAIGSSFETHYRHAIETGETADFEAYYSPLKLWCDVRAYPSEEGLAVYFRSINERKQAEQQRDATMAELQRSNRELQDFAFVASHDLQEPLRKIQTFSDRLLRDPAHFDEREQDYLKRMESAAKRMQTLIMDLLAYSRVSTRTQPFKQCDLNKIVSEVLQDLEAAIADSNASIEVTDLPALPGDSSQLRQVFQNLLSNALKFRRSEEQPVIRVYSEKVSDSGWTLVVADNGAGFDPRYADRMFQPFQRLHSRKDYAGTGIGLAIVRKIVERHNGTISAEGRPGEGAIFRIHFMSHHLLSAHEA